MLSGFNLRSHTTRKWNCSGSLERNQTQLNIVEVFKASGWSRSCLQKLNTLPPSIEPTATGSMISMEKGNAIPYSLDKLQERGKFFVAPNEDVYTGQVIGENSRGDDMVVNVTKTKKLSNVRSSGADDKVKFVLDQVQT